MKQNKFFPSGEQPNAMVFAVNVIPASRGQIQDYLLVGGEVGASSAIDVFADTAGRLLSLSVAVGQEVRANQVVAEVDPSRPGMNFVPSPVRSPISGTVLHWKLHPVFLRDLSAGLRWGKEPFYALLVFLEKPGRPGLEKFPLCWILFLEQFPLN